jgi:hypothetical protein
MSDDQPKPIVLDGTQIAKDETSDLLRNCVLTVVFTVIYMSLGLGVLLMVVFMTDLQTNVWAAVGVGILGALVILTAVVHIMFAIQRARSGGCPCA